MIQISEDRLRSILAWVVIALVGGPVTGAVMLGLLHGDSPCILCWAERTSMILIGLAGLMVIRYGPRPRYLGMAVLLAVWGSFMSIRHSGLHLARDIGQGFSTSILGAHTYVWSWFIHAVVLVVIGFLLLLLPRIAPEEGPRRPTRAGQFAMVLFVVVTAVNALQAFASTGPPPFMGQADPVRLSLDPSRWVWSLEELQPSYLSLRGSWTVPEPDPDATDPDPDHGPLADLPALSVSGWEEIGVPLRGTLAGLAYDRQTGRFLAVTDDRAVYVMDPTLSEVLHYAVLDPGYSVDLTPLAGSAFLGGDTLAVLSTNKSYALLLADESADADLEWRHFLESNDRMTESRRSRFQTVRAHQMYVLSLAFDRSAGELVTIGVPSPRHRRLVVSRFLRRDMVLSSEFEPELGGDLQLRSPDRTLADYVVTGAFVENGILYAVSAAYSTLLVIDLRQRALVAAYTLPDVERPVGLVVRGDELMVAQADGRVAVVERP